MTSIEELKQKTATGRELKSVVKTMKALAAVSIHQYERAAESLREYNRTLEMGWQILLQKHSQKIKEESIRPAQNTACIVFGSDWGMCGQFNEKIAEYTQKYLNYSSASGSDTLILNVGARIGDRLTVMGHNCDASFNLPSSIVGITAIIQEIVLTLEEWRENGKVERIVVIYNCIASGAVYRPVKSILLMPSGCRIWNSENGLLLAFLPLP